MFELLRCQKRCIAPLHGPLFAALFLLVLSSLDARSADARRMTVRATGQAVIVKGNAQAAEAQAAAAAYRSAVEQVAGTLGGPKEGDDSVVDQALYERAGAFVTNSALINRKVDASILLLELSVEIEADAVQQALGGRRGAAHALGAAAKATEDLGGKRVLILATEQLGPQKIFGWRDIVFTPSVIATKTTMVRQVTEMGGIEATFSDGFSGAGFNVVDLHVLRGKLTPRPAFEKLDMSDDAGRQIAQKSDADLVVVAKGVAQINSSIALGSGMRSGQANVVARLIRVRDGKVLATTTQHAAQVHIDNDTAMLNAVNEAARLAAGELVKKVSN